jgi:hypothetical protein
MLVLVYACHAMHCARVRVQRAYAVMFYSWRVPDTCVSGSVEQRGREKETEFCCSLSAALACVRVV